MISSAPPLSNVNSKRIDIAVSLIGCESAITLSALRHEGMRKSAMRQSFAAVMTLWLTVPAMRITPVAASYEQTVITPRAVLCEPDTLPTEVPSAKHGSTDTAIIKQTSAKATALHVIFFFPAIRRHRTFLI